MSKKFLSPIKLAQGASVPASGSAGELFYNTTDLKVYSHNGTAWVATGGGVTNSATAPTSPANGDAWFNTNEGRLFIYYSDGTSNQWVEATPTPVSSENYQMPAGSIMAWGATTAPANWLLCDGAAVSRTTYASLFASIGTQYGVGDGSTTFNLPNLKGKVVVGLDAAQTEFDALGETGGAKTHTLLTSEMPSHTHVQDAHNHTQNAHNHTQDAHSHTYSGSTNTTGGHTHQLTGSNGGSGGVSMSITSNTNNDFAFGPMNGARAVYNGDHSHTFSGTTSSGAATNQATTATNNSTTATNQNTGGGGAHNNLQPYIVLNYIIKFSAGETPGDSQLATRVSAVEVANNATPLSPNYIINGAMDYWQRGTSGTVAANGAAYVSADRYRVIAAGGSAPTITFARSTDVPAGLGVQYSGSFSWSGTATSADLICNQYIENGKYLFAGKTVTVSFYAKATTAISSIVNFDQDYGSTTFNLTTSWARYSYTLTLPSTFATSRPVGTGANDHTELRFLRFTNSAVSSNTIYFTGVQVEEGPNATPFRRSAPSLQAELSACQRYYWRVTTVAGQRHYWAGQAFSTTGGVFAINFPVVMRAAPSTFEYGGGSAITMTASGAGNGGVATPALGSTSPYGGEFTATVPSAALTAGNATTLMMNGAAYIGVGAEI